MEVVFWAVDHGMESLRGGSRLVPFVVRVDASGQRLTERVLACGGDRRASLAAACRLAEERSPGAAVVAVAYDGYLTSAGERSRALYVDAREGDGPVLRFAQRYRSGRPPRPLEMLHFLGRVDSFGA